MFRRKYGKTKRRGAKKAVLGSAAVLLCVFLLFVTVGCSVTDIKVTGNYHVTDKEVINLLGTGPLSKSTVFLYLLNRNRKIGGNTFVDTLTVEPDGLHGVTVQVDEKKLIGCVEYEDQYWYFNRSGLVLVSSGGEEQKDGESLTEIMAVSEMASPGMCLADGLITVLAADSIIYGEEFDGLSVETEEAGEEDDGEETVGEAGEFPVNPDNDAEDMDGTDDPGADEYTGEESGQQEGPEDSEAEEGGNETGEQESSGGEQGAEDPVQEGTPVDPGSIIQPTIIADEGRSSGGSGQGQAPGTWEPDTSAKGGNYLPLVRGLVFSQAVLGYPLPVQFDRVFSSIAVLKSFVDRTGYVPDDVCYDSDGDLFVTYGQAVVNLGKGEHIEQRVMVIGEALPSFAGLSGTLHLENYDGTQNRLIFSKK